MIILLFLCDKNNNMLNKDIFTCIARFIDEPLSLFNLALVCRYSSKAVREISEEKKLYFTNTIRTKELENGNIAKYRYNYFVGTKFGMYHEYDSDENLKFRGKYMGNEYLRKIEITPNLMDVPEFRCTSYSGNYSSKVAKSTRRAKKEAQIHNNLEKKSDIVDISCKYDNTKWRYLMGQKDGNWDIYECKNGIGLLVRTTYKRGMYKDFKRC